MTTLSYSSAASADRQAMAVRQIAVWLLVCCGMVFAMAVIGAITRLTGSGLSMVEWRPLIGMLPPLTETEWNRVFGLYQLSPEYRYVNTGMTLDQFKEIFYWEWFHRLWGQLIGFVFLIPFLWFWATGRIPKSLWPKLLGLFALGGLQGFIGWFMVMSGLVDRPAVSHYRLALHLSMAFIIYGLLFWVAIGLLDPRPRSHRAANAAGLRRHARLGLLLVGVTVVWGAFVAGLDAGLLYPTWPLMGDRFMPGEAWDLAPAWINLFENHATVQFAHRCLALATGAVVLALSWRAFRSELAPRGRALALGVAGATVAQIGLGVSTLLSGVAIPLAALHQAGALVVITLLVWLLHELRRNPASGA